MCRIHTYNINASFLVKNHWGFRRSSSKELLTISSTGLQQKFSITAIKQKHSHQFSVGVVKGA